jgi:signal transduction histidine kinase
MYFLRAHIKAILLASAFAVVVAGLPLLANYWMVTWSERIEETNKSFAKIIAAQLGESAQGLIDSLALEGFFDADSSSHKEFEHVDRLFTLISTHVLTGATGFEGGFFLVGADEFVGYSYPSSPPPVPVYGPPPRSYGIIKTQVLESVRDHRDIVQLHRFDPAIFPLATAPIRARGTVVGAVWARVHIERELPILKMRQVVNVGGGIALLGFVVAVWVSMTQARRVSRLRADLARIQAGLAERVTDPGGKVGSITESINSMLDALDVEHERTEQLERELHQREKMSALGHLVAGVVHEVKTPLAIMKTRVQMWQRALSESRLRPDPSGNGEIITEESLDLVVHEINRLSYLVNRLLVFSRPMTDRLQRTDLMELLAQSVKLVETHPRNIRFELDPEPNPPLPLVLADKRALEQVFLNIFVNSVEAIVESGTIRIEVSYSEADDAVCVSVIDDGIGIPESVRSTVFDPFVTTKERGFGLGLSVASEIVTAHGGTIEFMTAESVGTHCRIRLPVNGKFRARRTHVG